MAQADKVKKVLLARSERVKCVELHPKEPLVLCSLYSGQVTLWNYDTQTMVKSFEIVDQQPVRAVKFITRMQCFVCVSDDMNIRVFNYNTMEKVKTFEGHQDYIRSIAVHDHLPYILTSSDDMTVRLWDWGKGYKHTMTYEGHAHYVMQVVFNPKDPSTFATASLDETIKVWSLTSPKENFTLLGHEAGVNCVEYYQGGDKPYLISGADDRTVRVWDYQTRNCIHVLSHHVGNVSCVMFHPDLPLLITGSEDETVGIFSTQTWRQEATLNYGLHRVWSLSGKPGQGKVALGFDNGLVVIKLGKDEPVISMDPNGKILIASNQEIVRMDIKNLSKDLQDNEPIIMPTKEVGTTENIPHKLLHGPSGQYIAVLFENEYTINSSLAWRPKSFGQAIDFIWGAENGTYAILENSFTVKTFKQFKQKDSYKLNQNADALFAGPLIGVRAEGSISFYDWENFRCVRKIDVSPKDVVWSDSGELVAIVTETAAFLLKYRVEEVTEHFESGKGTTPDGLDFAFDVVQDMEEVVKQAIWVGDCLTYVSANDRLNYYIGGEVTTVAVLPRPMFMLGYIAKENRVFLIDKEKVVVSFQLHVAVIDYKTAIVRDDFETAETILPRIPANMLEKVAQFLQARKHLELALKITPDEDHRFDLAIQLGRLDIAAGITRQNPTPTRWKQVGDLALQRAYFDVAEEALRNANDLNSLLLFYTSTGNMQKIAGLGKAAMAKGRANVAFTCFHLVGDHEACIDILCLTNRVPEAAFYARTYCHHRVQELVGKWKTQVASLPTVRESIADPESYPNLFPNIDVKKEKEATPVRDPSPKQESAQSSPQSETKLQSSPPSHVDPVPVVAASPSPATAAPANTPASEARRLRSPEMPAAPHTTPAVNYADKPGIDASPPPGHDDDLFADIPAPVPGDTATPPPRAASNEGQDPDEFDEIWGKE
jgi:coatomer subunit beta'